VSVADPGAATNVRTLAARAASCQACDLYRNATQVVFGEGPTPARLMLIGEQPGDREDLEGAPFVGPAGRVLDRALTAAGQDRDQVYVTNAVKHFKWSHAGKVRLHKKPNAAEIRACRPWWEAELAVVRPAVLCCLGATAAQVVFGRQFRVTRDRGRLIDLHDDVRGLATIHPSAVLRADPEDRERAFDGLVRDLKIAVLAAAE
jgi:uracil-DNA glycosylase